VRDAHVGPPCLPEHALCRAPLLHPIAARAVRGAARRRARRGDSMSRRATLVRLVLAHIRRVRGNLALATVCMLGLTLAQLLAPWPLKLIFDQILLGKPLAPPLAFLDGLLRSGSLVPLVVLSLAVLVIAVLRGALSYGQLYITSRVGVELAYTLRRELLTHLQRLSLSFHTHARSGELLTKI